MFSFGEFWGIVHCNCWYTGGVFLEFIYKKFPSLSYVKLKFSASIYLFFGFCVRSQH